MMMVDRAMERDAHGSGSTRGPDPRAGDGGQCPPELIAARGAPTTEPNDSGPEVLLDPGNHNLPFRMKQHRIRASQADLVILFDLNGVLACRDNNKPRRGQVRRKYHVRPGVSHILALLGGLCAGQDPSPVIHLGVSTSATRPSAMAALAAIHSAMLQEAGQHPDWPGSAFVRANRDAIAAGAKRSWWLSDRYNSRTRSDEDGAAADEPGSDAEGATGRGYWAAGCKNGVSSASGFDDPDGVGVFRWVLSRDSCVPVSAVEGALGSHDWSIVKMLSRHFVDTSRVVLVEDSADKGHPSELPHMILVPEFTSEDRTQGWASRDDNVLRAVVEGVGDWTRAHWKLGARARAADVTASVHARQELGPVQGGAGPSGQVPVAAVGAEEGSQGEQAQRKKKARHKKCKRQEMEQAGVSAVGADVDETAVVDDAGGATGAVGVDGSWAVARPRGGAAPGQGWARGDDSGDDTVVGCTRGDGSGGGRKRVREEGWAASGDDALPPPPVRRAGHATTSQPRQAATSAPTGNWRDQPVDLFEPPGPSVTASRASGWRDKHTDDFALPGPPTRAVQARGSWGDQPVDVPALPCPPSTAFGEGSWRETPTGPALPGPPSRAPQAMGSWRDEPVDVPASRSPLMQAPHAVITWRDWRGTWRDEPTDVPPFSAASTAAPRRRSASTSLSAQPQPPVSPAPPPPHSQPSSPAPPVPLTLGSGWADFLQCVTGGRIFMCNSETESECLGRTLFGAPNVDAISAIRPTTALFLCNFEALHVMGVFAMQGDVTSAVGRALEPSAFGGRFPYHVRVRQLLPAPAPPLRFGHPAAACPPGPTVDTAALKQAHPAVLGQGNRLRTHLPAATAVDICRLFEARRWEETAQVVRQAVAGAVGMTRDAMRGDGGGGGSTGGISGNEGGLKGGARGGEGASGRGGASGGEGGGAGASGAEDSGRKGVKGKGRGSTRGSAAASAGSGERAASVEGRQAGERAGAQVVTGPGEVLLRRRPLTLIELSSSSEENAEGGNAGSGRGAGCGGGPENGGTPAGLREVCDEDGRNSDSGSDSGAGSEDGLAWGGNVTGVSRPLRGPPARVSVSSGGSEGASFVSQSQSSDSGDEWVAGDAEDGSDASGYTVFGGGSGEESGDDDLGINVVGLEEGALPLRDLEDPTMPAAMRLRGGARRFKLRKAAPAPPLPPAATGGLQAYAHLGDNVRSSLHFELVAFARHCEPSPSAQALAHEARRVVAESARRCFGKAAQVEAFGSQATGLALPGGDLDLVVLGVTGHVQLGGYQRPVFARRLSEFLADLRQSGAVHGRASVIQAKVPIIKCHIRTRPGAPAVRTDISMGAANGLDAVNLVRRHLAQVPQARPLVLAVKALLQHEGLNEVFTGGLSSYAVTNMVLCHLLYLGLVPSTTPSPAPVPGRPLGARHGNDLGVLLHSFLNHFGRTFSYSRQVVSLAGGGYVPRDRGRWRYEGGQGLLAVEDPQSPGKSITAGSFRMQDVKEAFRAAADALGCAMPQTGDRVGLVPEAASEAAMWAQVQGAGSHASVAAHVTHTSPQLPILNTVFDVTGLLGRNAPLMRTDAGGAGRGQLRGAAEWGGLAPMQARVPRQQAASQSWGFWKVPVMTATIRTISGRSVSLGRVAIRRQAAAGHWEWGPSARERMGRAVGRAVGLGEAQRPDCSFSGGGMGAGAGGEAGGEGVSSVTRHHRNLKGCARIICYARAS